VTIALLFVGFGNVARRFVDLLDESREALAAAHLDPFVVGIATRRHGAVFSTTGIDARAASRQIFDGKAIGPAASMPIAQWIAQLRDVRADAKVLIECTTLDITAGEPATTHVRAGFAAGADVISANKGPVAFAYRQLQREARDAGVSFLFEGAVMDGIPVFNLVRHALPAATIRGFRGVVNSTTNHIITAMERGEAYERALARMQVDGVAEADPSLDVDGWDAAAKTAALANVWLDAGITPHDVARSGIGPATAARALAALRSGRRLKLIAEAGRTGDRIDARVELRELENGDPLAALDGQGNALEIDTWPAGRIVITQRDGGLEKTAYALLSDLFEIGARRRRSQSQASTSLAGAVESTPEVDLRGRPPGSLDGITILDLSRVLAGPYCTMLASDMGARVIKIEHPAHGDDTRGWGPPFIEGESAYYLSVNRNKESVALDFKTADGRAALDALIARADVLVENFRPGTLDAIGLSYRDLAVRHPRLIYVSISGFGQTGPRRDEAGYDAVAQAESGLMSITGTPDGPPVRLGVAIADIASGMFAYQGLLAALIARERTGRGQRVDVGLLDAATALLTYQASRALATGVAPKRAGNQHLSIAPYDTFATKDGGVLILAIGNDGQWPVFCRIAGLDAQAADARYTTNAGRVTHYAELRPIIAFALAQRATGDWISKLRAAGVPCGAVRSVTEALADPQIAAREMIVTLDHPSIGPLRMLGNPVKLSDTPGAIRTAPPELGADTARVFEEFGIQIDLGGRFPSKPRE